MLEKAPAYLIEADEAVDMLAEGPEADEQLNDAQIEGQLAVQDPMAEDFRVLIMDLEELLHLTRIPSSRPWAEVYGKPPGAGMSIFGMFPLKSVINKCPSPSRESNSVFVIIFNSCMNRWALFDRGRRGECYANYSRVSFQCRSRKNGEERRCLVRPELPNEIIDEEAIELSA